MKKNDGQVSLDLSSEIDVSEVHSSLRLPAVCFGKLDKRKTDPRSDKLPRYKDGDEHLFLEKIREDVIITVTDLAKAMGIDRTIMYRYMKKWP